MQSILTRRLAPSARATRLRAKIAWARDRQVAVLTRRIALFFREEADRVVERYLRSKGLYTKADGDNIFDYDEEDLALARAILRQLGISAGIASEIAAGFIDDASPTETERIGTLITRSATKVRSINAYTRGEIRDTIMRGVAHGYTPAQIAEGVPADGFRGLRSIVEETYKGRAKTIARTEVGEIMNLAAVDRYQRAGGGLVEVMDGPECGWKSHDDPDVADGSIRTIEDALLHVLAHPNCRRIFLPYNPSQQDAGARVVPVPEIVHA